MKKAKYFNRHQYRFFNNLKDHPTGLPGHLQPTAATMERWMHQLEFREAFEAILAQQELVHSIAVRNVALTTMAELSKRMEAGDVSVVPEMIRVLKLAQKAF